MDPESSMVSSAAEMKTHNLFQVYLRLRPPQAGGATAAAAAAAERFLAVEPSSEEHAAPTHVTLNPPNDRRRAVEKFAFTQVFEEDASQLDVFHCTGVVPLVEGVLAPHGGDGTDALLATLGVTGSGKTHTILGSRSQRGLIQLSLDVIFRSLGTHILECTNNPSLEASITAADASEAAVFSAPAFLETVFGDMSASAHASSRAPTPMTVGSPTIPQRPPSLQRHAALANGLYPPLPSLREFEVANVCRGGSPKSIRIVSREDSAAPPSPFFLPRRLKHGRKESTHGGPTTRSRSTREGRQGSPKQESGILRTPKLALRTPARHFMTVTASVRQKNGETKTALLAKVDYHASTAGPPPTPKRLVRASALPQTPDVSAISVSCDPSAEYTILISMYEVYNDRIFDLLTPPIKSAATKEYRRRPLLFKSTEMSPDRKIVAGLRKIICSSFNQALMVLEAGLQERRVAGTGINSVSSRSHGFFCVEVKKRAAGRRPGAEGPWGGSTLTIVDLAGSERARDAKTAGATLAEAGKINESLMYLGQCLQMQSDAANKDKPSVVPFRQCKLTELLFSNSFPSNSHSQSMRKTPQKGVMIVTADPHGDFNATSQILRYSALAREITVPRIPSITQTILAAAAAASAPPMARSSSPIGPPPINHRPFYPPGSTASVSASYNHGPNVQRTISPTFSAHSSDERATMELAALEIARLAEEAEYLRSALSAEREARITAEAHMVSLEDRLLEVEAAVREDCAAEYERRVELEVARWKASMAVEMERGEEHWGRKIEVFERTLAVPSSGPAVVGDSADTGDVHVHEDAGADAMDRSGDDKENVLIENVHEENDRLRRDNETLRRDLAALSPTKRKPLRERGSSDQRDAPVLRTSTPRASRTGGGGGMSLQSRMEQLRVSEDGLSVRSTSDGSPKKMRKLTDRRWDSALDGEGLF